MHTKKTGSFGKHNITNRFSCRNEIKVISAQQLMYFGKISHSVGVVLLSSVRDILAKLFYRSIQSDFAN